MSMLARVTTGRIKRPYAILVYGPDGVGKTTFGSEAPSPIFLGPEMGTSNMDVARFPTPESWADVISALDELASAKHDFKTLVVDSLDWLEPILHRKICLENGNARSIELAAGGYGKGYKEALNEWIRFKEKLDVLRDKRGMNIVLLAHSEVVQFNDPAIQMTYDRFQLKLHKSASAFFREYVEAVLFVNFDVIAKKDGQTVRAYGDGERKAWTERRTGFDAKNRLDLPFELQLVRGKSWSSFVACAQCGSPERPEAVRKRIDDMLVDVKDEQLKGKVVASVTKAVDNPAQLAAIETRLKTLLTTSAGMS